MIHSSSTFICSLYELSYADRLQEKLSYEFSGMRVIFNLLDILLIATLLYLLFMFLKKHNCTRLIKFVVIALFVTVVLSSKTLGLTLTGQLANYGILIVVVGLLLLFPQESRRSLWKISSPKEAVEVFNTDYGCSDEELKHTVSEIVRAAQNMAKKNVGALIVIAPQDIPYNILESGTKLDAELSCALLESIFNTKAPLHDGAVFIRGNRVIAAGCFLPLTQNTEVDKELGTRHRAAIGVTETNNVLAIIVSEETGVISTAIDGQITRYYDSAMLTDKLEQVYGLKAVEKSEKKLRRRKNA